MNEKPGQPKKYKTPEELQAKINEYFEVGVNLREVIVGPPQNRTKVLLKVPTICGLVLYLGFCDRSSFYNYEQYPEFSYTIKTARTRIEQEYEEQLQCGAPTGAIFALKNFDWKDSPLIDQSQHHTLILQIEKDNDKEIKTARKAMAGI